MYLSLKRLTVIFSLLCLVIVWILLTNLPSPGPCSCTLDRDGNAKEQSVESDQLAVLVPFRERTNQLLQFIPHMNAFLRRQNISHEFYVINQVDKYRFNRASLINVGFLLARNRSSYIAIHDVDLLPLNDKLSYQYPLNGPFHVSAPGLHPKYNYSTYVGGILLMQNTHFELVNGFSNNYWGWGLEDDEFYTRLRDANLQVYRPEKINTDHRNTFLHLHDQSVPRDTVKIFNQSEVTRRKDRQTGLRTTRFQLRHEHKLTLEGVPFRVLDVELECDHIRTPWCQKPVSQRRQRARPA